MKKYGGGWKYKEWSLFVVVYFFTICVYIKEVVCDKCFDF